MWRVGTARTRCVTTPDREDVVSKRTQACIRAHLGWSPHTPHTEQGPETLKDSPYHAQWAAHIDVWRDVWPRHSALQEPHLVPHKPWPEIVHCVERLAQASFEVIQSDATSLFLGGDHAMAAGTWRGVARALKQPMGLIWLDAHMDAQSPESSASKDMRRMPLAALLGKGVVAWGAALTQPPALRPEHVVLLGLRSHEADEKTFLQEQGVRVFLMEEIADRGVAVVYQEAVATLLQKVDRLGITLDLEFFDPEQVPGVGACEQQGVDVAAFLKTFAQDTPWSQVVGFEIAGYNPDRDVDHKTRTVVEQVIQCWLARSL